MFPRLTRIDLYLEKSLSPLCRVQISICYGLFASGIYNPSTLRSGSRIYGWLYRLPEIKARSNRSREEKLIDCQQVRSYGMLDLYVRRVSNDCSKEMKRGRVLSPMTSRPICTYTLSIPPFRELFSKIAPRLKAPFPSYPDNAEWNSCSTNESSGLACTYLTRSLITIGDDMTKVSWDLQSTLVTIRSIPHTETPSNALSRTLQITTISTPLSYTMLTPLMTFFRWRSQVTHHRRLRSPIDFHLHVFHPVYQYTRRHFPFRYWRR